MPTDSTYLSNSITNITDSIEASYDTISLQANQIKSFLTEKNIGSFQNTELKKDNTDWLSGMMLLAMLLLAATNFLFRKRFRQIINAFLGRNYANQLMREGNLFKDQISIFLSLIYAISIPAFYLIGAITLFPEAPIQLNIQFFLYSLIIVLGLWFVKAIIIRFTAILFNTGKASYEILTHLLIYNLTSGFVLLPATILFHYSETIYILYINIGLWIIINILRFIRLISVGFSYSIFSTLHLFLYLCTLEIIPSVLLIKLLMIKLG